MKTLLQLDAADLDTLLTKKLTEIQNAATLARYQDREVCTNTVADIHKVDRDTVLRYAKAGLIPHRREGKLYLFSMRTVLKLDFHQLRTKKTA